MNKYVLTFLLFLSAWPMGLPLAADPASALEPDQAFRFAYMANNGDALSLSWDIADGHYLYRHKFKFVSLTPGIAIGTPSYPAAQAKHDNFFGNVEVFRGKLQLGVPLLRQKPAATMLTLEVSYQGCADAGICYLPIKKTLSLDLPVAADSIQAALPSFIAEQDRIAAALNGGSLWLSVLSFFGFGLLLAFTPCMFPMIPILSGLIVGQKHVLTTRKAFALSLAYVLASAITYTLFGVLAGLFGSNLQSFFQAPWAVAAFSGLFILLALSMLGIFQLQAPAFIQTKLMTIGARQRRGSLAGAMVMGMLSALAVGPCITAPLAGALIYIGQTGDAVLGGMALFALGLGMGTPLLIIGTSAGKWLPKAGAWMEATKTVFAMGLLAVAVWFLGRILPANISMVLWAVLLFAPLLYLGWNKFRKGAVALGCALLILAAVITYRQQDYLGLLCEAAIACEARPGLAFQKVASLQELQRSLANAQAQNRWVMLDIYADWCVACQEMERDTFSDPKVQAALAQVVVLQADITANSAADQALLKHFELIGPPVALFFGPDQQERKTYRVVGYLPADEFLVRLKQVFQ